MKVPPIGGETYEGFVQDATQRASMATAIRVMRELLEEHRDEYIRRLTVLKADDSDVALKASFLTGPCLVTRKMTKPTIRQVDSKTKSPDCSSLEPWIEAN